MAAPTLVQSNWAEGSSVTSLAVTLSSGGSGADVTAGNTLVAAYAFLDTGTTRDLKSLSDDQANTWNIDENLGATAFTRAIGSADNVAGGSTQVTATIDFSGDIALVVAEVSGADPTDGYDTSDSFDDTDSSDANHYCAASPGIATATDVFLIAVDGVSVGAVGSYVAPSGWTMLRSSTSHSAQGYAVAYFTSASALTNERAVFTQTGTNRASKGAVASYKAAAAGGSVLPLLDHHYRTMRA